MNTNNVEYQLTLKVKHSQSSSEKLLQTWKDHFLLEMSSTHLDFPLLPWCKLVQQGRISLNFLCSYRLKTRPSAYAQVFGTFNSQKNQLKPPGMKLLAHVLPIKRCLFDLHAIKEFSVGVAMENYR